LGLCRHPTELVVEAIASVGGALCLKIRGFNLGAFKGLSLAVVRVAGSGRVSIQLLRLRLEKISLAAVMARMWC
jgi:hypothetical protein